MARSSQLRHRWYDYNPEREQKLSTIKGRPMKAHDTAPVETKVPDSFESPESSTIAGASYQDGTLSVMFKRGAGARERYDYSGIPAELWAEFVMADSKGQFFGARIRPLYRGTKIVRK
jgi:hypothetical protein